MNIKKLLVDYFLANEKPLSAHEIVKIFTSKYDIRPVIVRATLWQLISDGELRFTQGRKICLKETNGKLDL